MLLILTNSLDGTVDLLLEGISSIPVFRFNIDLWRDYDIEISHDSFFIQDPTGRRVDEKTVQACYWRKPSFDDAVAIPAGGSLDGWIKSQWRYVTREVWNICRNAGKARLVSPASEPCFGKVLQLRLAQKYFRVPKWFFVKSSSQKETSFPTVAKSLTMEFVENFKVFYTRRVDPTALDCAYPWFLQSEVDASHDLTVVYVAGRCFGFTLDRELFEGIDWRIDINRVEHPWEDYELGPDLTRNICAFMDEARLSYGRLDFLLKDGEAWFLEVNPNGQYAWLDQSGRQGMMAAIIEELTTDNPRKPIPHILP